MVEEMIPITAERLIPEATRLKNDGCRLVTLTCSLLPDEAYRIIYTFDRNYDLVHLSLNVSGDPEVPSLSSVYWAAFLVENEIQDLFGLRFKGLAIDYRRTLYLDGQDQEPPFNRGSLKGD
jgi:NADH:ubiquinone oxidoreductase subunit C